MRPSWELGLLYLVRLKPNWWWAGSACTRLVSSLTRASSSRQLPERGKREFWHWLCYTPVADGPWGWITTVHVYYTCTAMEPNRLNTVDSQVPSPPKQPWLSLSITSFWPLGKEMRCWRRRWTGIVPSRTTGRAAMPGSSCCSGTALAFVSASAFSSYRTSFFIEIHWDFDADKEHFEPTIEHLFELDQGNNGATRIIEAWAIDCQNHGKAAPLNDDLFLRKPKLLSAYKVFWMQAYVECLTVA